MPSRSNATVSLCMIVRNEESNLRDCLSPVARLFDQVVIVDTGSTDHTREIAREFTDDVHEFRWCDDFSAARNEGLRHATGDWIFWLDADDRIPPGEVPKLAHLLNGLDLQPRAYLMNTTCRPQYDSDGARLLSHYRLFRRHPEMQWRGRVHEQLRPEPTHFGMQISHHSLRILHLGYADGAMQVKKAQRDIRLLRMDFAANPEDVSTTMHLAFAYARAAKFADAINYLNLLESRMQAPQDWQRGVYKLLVDLSVKCGALEQALQHANRGLSVFPADTDLLYARAEVLYEMDNYQSCLTTLLRLQKLPEQRVTFGNSLSDIRTKWAPLLIADACRELGRSRHSIKTLKEILKHHPGDVRVMHSLGLTYIRAGLRSQLPALRQSMGKHPQGEVFALLLFVVEGLMYHSLEGMEEAFARLISLAPQMARPRILLVEYLGRVHAPVGAYLSACRDALRVCPNHDVIRQRVAYLEQTLGLPAMP